ncbi:MAG: contact-dependent growth inhibition system immunity protein [Nocardioides sp.]
MDEALVQLMAGYLHQDWDLDHASWQDAVDAFVRDQPDLAADVPDQVARALSQARDDDAIRDLCLSWGSAYRPTAADGTRREWLSQVSERVMRRLRDSER